MSDYSKEAGPLADPDWTPEWDAYFRKIDAGSSVILGMADFPHGSQYMILSGEGLSRSGQMNDNKIKWEELGHFGPGYKVVLRNVYKRAVVALIAEKEVRLLRTPIPPHT